jgi:dipeptidyl aminopeptidase/acylaminoacyl peptidase
VTTERNGRSWDVHQQTLSGTVTKLFEPDDGYWYPLDWSPDGKRLLIKNRVSINISSVHELDIATRRLTPLLGAGKAVSIEHAAYDGQGDVVYTSDENAEFLRLHRLDRSTREVEVLTQDIPWNIETFGFSPQYDKLLYAVNAGGLSKLGLMSWPSRVSQSVPELPKGILTSLAFAPDGTRVAIGLTSAVSPADVYVADLTGNKLTRWTRSEVGGLDQESFVDVDLIEYPTFDGRKIPAFVYQPQTPGPHPVVIYIHGGPEAQYRPYFSTTMQSYVNEMNVTVIAPNVRGSNGYGKSYLQLDNGKLREDSVKDIGALLDWIDTQDRYRSDRVAVMGGSYGGYMVLASMVHYGKRLAAAVDSVGISNFVTFLENTQPYRQDMRRVEYGDERDPDMRAHLQSISPLNHVERMVTPVLISQGANDPRVPASESEQIRIALDAAGVPAWYILAKDEGHGFRKKVNRDYDRVAKFAFLEQYLRAE